MDFAGSLLTALLSFVILMRISPMMDAVVVWHFGDLLPRAQAGFSPCSGISITIGQCDLRRLPAD